MDDAELLALIRRQAAPYEDDYLDWRDVPFEARFTAAQAEALCRDRLLPKNWATLWDPPLLLVGRYKQVGPRSAEVQARADAEGERLFRRVFAVTLEADGSGLAVEEALLNPVLVERSPGPRQDAEHLHHVLWRCALDVDVPPLRTMLPADGWMLIDAAGIPRSEVAGWETTLRALEKLPGQGLRISHDLVPVQIGQLHALGLRALLPDEPVALRTPDCPEGHGPMRHAPQVRHGLFYACTDEHCDERTGTVECLEFDRRPVGAD